MQMTASKSEIKRNVDLLQKVVQRNTPRLIQLQLVRAENEVCAPLMKNLATVAVQEVDIH
jgi:hypothetical protein